MNQKESPEKVVREIRRKTRCKFSAEEKMEVIHLVENSELGVKRTLLNPGINKSTFYNWYSRYHDQGYDGLAPRKPVVNTGCCRDRRWDLPKISIHFLEETR